MLRGTLIAACVVVAMSSATYGQVKLEQKLHEGNSYTIESTTQLEQQLTIAGTDVDTKGDSRSVVKATVGKRDAEGKLPVQEKIESLQASMSVQGMNYQFDSANPDAKGDSQLEVLREVHKVLAARTTTIVYDKFDRVVAVEANKDDFSAVPVEIQNMVKSQIDPETLKTAANQGRDQITSDPVKQGDTWKRTQSQDFGSGQVMTFENEYTYAGTVEKDGKTLDKIESKTTGVTFALGNSPLPFTLKASELKPAESAGVILFDRERGQVVESDSTVRITGSMTFNVNNMDLPATLDLKMHTVLAVKP